MNALPKLNQVLLDRRKSTVVATLNRPEAKNALSAAMIADLFALCDWLNANQDVRALVLRGAGGTFCAGGDIKDFSAQLAAPAPSNGGEDPVAAGNRRFGDLLLQLDSLPQAFIVVVEGAAFGGALGLIAVSDVAIADEETQFSLSETTLGLPPAQIAPFLVRRIGLAHARRLSMMGARFGAEKAWNIGLVSYLEDADGLDDVLSATLNQIGRCEPGANAVTKQLLTAAAASGVDPKLLDDGARAFARCLRGKGKEGAEAFAEKRQPDWVETYTERPNA
ncbi:MAG: enoyl-CoA hydratase-related protein [Pseudomonadota bacterium]|nr:enoyl-CoA hydratase-related protein [Pseudomonadota bacterium]